MTISSKERAALRAEAQALKASVHVGHQGVIPSLVQTLDDALRTHELVKVALTRTVDATAKEVAQQLGERTQADVVQVIGRTATFYRINPVLHEKAKKGDLPPWRR